MKVEILHRVSPRICKADEMETGQIGIVLGAKMQIWNGHRLLKIGAGVISLDNPDCCWEITCPYEVEVLPTGTQIMLTTEV